MQHFQNGICLFVCSGKHESIASTSNDEIKKLLDILRHLDL